MKRLFVLLLAATLLLCLAACGNADETPAEPTEAPALTEAASDAPAATDAAALIGEIKSNLIGSWSNFAFDGVKLTFRDNGTGSYLGLSGAERSFLYLLSVSHEAYNNGEEYVNYLMSVKYDNGASEDIVIDIRDNDGAELVLYGIDGGGYSGLIDFDVWTKE